MASRLARACWPCHPHSCFAARPPLTLPTSVHIGSFLGIPECGCLSVSKAFASGNLCSRHPRSFGRELCGHQRLPRGLAVRHISCSPPGTCRVSLDILLFCPMLTLCPCFAWGFKPWKSLLSSWLAFDLSSWCHCSSYLLWHVAPTLSTWAQIALPQHLSCPS